MDLRPMDKVVIITGGAKGIGAAITRASIRDQFFAELQRVRRPRPPSDHGSATYRKLRESSRRDDSYFRPN
jgi:NAD(P)-dependent dehydrogenase (short-subunit alcohol dehydrogenase family)